MLDPAILSALYTKRQTEQEFNWDKLYAPSMYCFMSEYDMERLANISTSIKYSGNILKKEAAIKSILNPLGFRRFASGTNRLIYTYLEDTSFVLKVAIDKIGMRNCPDEFRNQAYLKPFVSKCFEFHPSGVVGMFERVMPITNLEEFVSVWDDIFEAIINMIGEYVIEDIGTKFFMNWAIRKNFGPVLCDYPEMFKLDGNKLFCTRPVIPGTKFPQCGGTIDYDAGFNYLVCTTCGKEYRASEISEAIKNKLLIMRGEVDMDVQLMDGNRVIVDSRDGGTDIIKPMKIHRPKDVRASIVSATIEGPTTSIVQEVPVDEVRVPSEAEEIVEHAFEHIDNILDTNSIAEPYYADKGEDYPTVDVYLAPNEEVHQKEQSNKRVKPVLPGGSGNVNSY